MAYIWSYMKKYPLTLVGSFLGSIIFVIVNLGLPTILAKIINESLINEDYSSLWQNISWMFVLVIIGLLGNILNVYAGSRITTSVVRDIRNDMYRKIQNYSHQEYETIGVPSLITRMTTDAFVIMQYTEILLRSALTPVLMIAGSIILIFLNAPSLSWLLFSAIPFIILIFYVIITRSRPLSQQLQVVLDKINLSARENLTGLRVVRAFAREDYQVKKFGRANDEYANLALRLNKLMGSAQPLFAHVLMWVTVITIWSALGPLEQGSIQVGTILAFTEYLFHALFAIMMFSQIFMMSPRALASANRLKDVVSMPISIDPNSEGVKRTSRQGYVEFKNVSFAYPDEPEFEAIKNISFQAAPGQTTAFIGSTGSGKSTIIQLVPRLFDVTVGAVLVDGVDVRDYNIKSLRDKIGYVPQKINLFEGTIRENLQFANKDLSESEMDHAIDVAQAGDFISGLEKGYDSFLSEGGSNFSGGQKQRLSIARAIAKKPSIYIFDDSFSALDYQTDAELRRRLAAITTQSTVLLVAQRVSSIVNADQIIVLDKGEIAGQGTHEELLAGNKIYQEIAESQTNEGEVD